MNKVAVIILMTMYSLNIYCQKETNSNTYVSLGGVVTSFQDIKFSNVRYNGIGVSINFGFEKEMKNLWGINLELIFSEEQAKTHIGQSIMLNAILNTKFLIPVLNNRNTDLHIGGTWDIIDLNFRFDDRLDNNGFTYISTSGIKLSSIYKRKFSARLKLEAGLDFQIFGLVKEIPSFAITENQNMLESGEFSYQNMEANFPNKLKYYAFEPFWDYINTSISVKLHYKKRWAFSYKWNMRRSNRIKGYPLTRGYNTIAIIYKISTKQ